MEECNVFVDMGKYDAKRSLFHKCCIYLLLITWKNISKVKLVPPKILSFVTHVILASRFPQFSCLFFHISYPLLFSL